MKKVIFWAVMFSLATSLQAGLMDKIKIKKAIAAAKAKVEPELAKVKSACGNKKLDLSVDWDKWGSYGLDASKQEQTLGYVATLIVNEVFNTMINACKDADYKAAIGETTKIAISGKDKFSDMYIAFKYKKGTLDVKLNGDGYGSWKNKELFMNAW